MESSVTMEDLVDPDQVTSINTRESNNEREKNHQNLQHEDGDDFDVGPLKVVKKRLKQFSSSESDDDSPSKTDNESDDESRLHKNNHTNKDISLVKKPKIRIQSFSDSESDYDKENNSNVTISKTNSNNSDEDLQFKNKKHKSRLKIATNSDSSDSGSCTDEALKNEQQQLRMKNKRNKLKEKFKSLVTSRLNESHTEKVINSLSGSESERDNIENANCSEQSDHDETSVEKIKQIIKDNSASYKITICDPDTSDEENYPSTKSMPQKMKERKRSMLTSPKPVRMTAKQALENMKKIKSESNRMLREKEVTLPYHRPKALSLKDIMSRRKPAVSSDGKSLPIKMNEEQLKQYAKMLEERQKEMMELCKSDTDDDPEENEPEHNEESSNQFNTKPSEEEVNIEELKQDVNKKSEDNIEISNNNVDSFIPTDDNKLTNVECINTDEVKNIGESFSDVESSPKIVDDNTEKLANLDVLSNSNNIIEGINNAEVVNKSIDKITETANDSMNSSASNAEMSLVYNDSIEEASNENIVAFPNNGEDNTTCKKTTEIDYNQRTEEDSQLVSLHYDTEKTEINSDSVPEIKENEPHPSTSNDISDIAFDEVCRENNFSDDDMINMDEIDNLIENADILKGNNNPSFANSPMLITDSNNSTLKPKLTGAPGMVIDLDGSDAIVRKKLTGLELLKERFTYFAKLKTPEELEREKEKRLKPGTQHLKLKQELEEKIAEQRSLEWAKRLEEEKKQQMEMDTLRGDESEDEIEKIEAKLDEKEETLNEESSESEESEDEMQEIEEKPRKKNPMIDDEAEESDEEECVEDKNEEEEQNIENDIDEEINDEESDESSEESSESEEEMETKSKKGRILKAFEDTDDEDDIVKDKVYENLKEEKNENNINLESQVILESQVSQDEDIQLAQRHKSLSGDLFTSQESAAKTNVSGSNEEPDIGTQTFSILNEAITSMAIDLDEPEKLNVISETQPNDDPSLDAVVGMCSGRFTQNPMDSQIPSTGLPVGDKLSVISETQPNDEPNLDTVVGMCSGSFSQNLVTTQLPAESQPIGEDILNLCTGKFYDNQFVSLTNDDVKNNQESQISTTTQNNEKPTEKKMQDDNLTSILEELNDPEFEEPRPKKYFMDNPKDVSNMQFKKKFIIDSDDETNDETSDIKQKKKIKKKKLEKRALQISDDEDDELEEEFEDEEAQDYVSDIEEDAGRLVEYDSEENEVEIKPQKEKKKRKMAEFFEQEAELTSEDEWVGSGDEDEADLDRMEREEGDDDTFNQRKLQKELGQIHMRDVLDQDKREVRLIQELLFEDADLGDGHRQRKFRWRNADGEEEYGAVPDELADTQEEEMESEEQWRKQRHERELFLRQMQNKDEEEINVSINRTTIIKANLCSRTMSSLLLEANKTTSEANECENNDSPVVLEKKQSKDIPSPKKAFAVFQQSYHGSLLSRGGSALARLGALAAPLTEDAPRALPPASKRNFVFTMLSQPEPEPKVTKRKADTNDGTPKLVKKMKTEDKKNPPRSSLLDHFKV